MDLINEEFSYDGVSTCWDQDRQRFLTVVCTVLFCYVLHMCESDGVKTSLETAASGLIYIQRGGWRGRDIVHHLDKHIKCALGKKCNKCTRVSIKL